MQNLIREHVHIKEKQREKAQDIAKHYFGGNKSLVYREAIKRGLDQIIKEKLRG